MTRAIFLGTPQPAIPSLLALSELAQIALVVTRPDRPRGRSGKTLPPPVKEAAAALGVPTAQPSSKEELIDAVAGASDGLDVGVLVAYGMIIPPEVLALPEHGLLNLHFSLLPRWRGAAPIERAIMAGDTVTGVTIIRMDEGLDTGPVVVSRETSIEPDDTAGALSGRLARDGADLLTEILPGYLGGELIPRPQRGQATYAEKLDPSEGKLDLEAAASTVGRVVRALNPRPGAYAEWKGQRLKLWQVAPGPSRRLKAGELTVVEGRLYVATGDGILELVEVQPAGGRRMSGVEWARGRQGPLGSLA